MRESALPKRTASAVTVRRRACDFDRTRHNRVQHVVTFLRNKEGRRLGPAIADVSITVKYVEAPPEKWGTIIGAKQLKHLAVRDIGPMSISDRLSVRILHVGNIVSHVDNQGEADVFRV